MLRASGKHGGSQENVNRQIDDYIKRIEHSNDHVRGIEEIIEDLKQISNNETNANQHYSSKPNVFFDTGFQKALDPMFCMNVCNEDHVAVETLDILSENVETSMNTMQNDNSFQPQQQNNQNPSGYVSMPEFYDSTSPNYDYCGQEYQTTPNLNFFPEIKNDVENWDQNTSNNIYSDENYVCDELKPQYQSTGNNANNNNADLVTGFADLSVNSPTDQYYGGVEIIKSEEEEPFHIRRQKKTVIPRIKPRRNRATKQQLKNVNMKERKKEQARTNTANYNLKMKKEKEDLKVRYELNMRELKKATIRNSNIKKNMDYCYFFCNNFGNYSPITEFNNHAEHHRFNMRNTKEDDEAVELLRKSWNTAHEEHQKAVGNVDQKNRNANTYGSTKSRAKSKEEVAALKYNLKVDSLKISNLESEFDYLKSLKTQWKFDFQRTIWEKNINLKKMVTMPAQQLQIFEKLLTFFDLPNPA